MGVTKRFRSHAARAARLSLLAVFLPLAACDQESPTEAGGPLIPGDAVNTFQIVLNSALWLEADTAFSGFGNVFNAGYFVVAEDYDGTLDSHIIARFDVPLVITISDSAGVAHTDSVPHIIGGRILLQLDTARSNASSFEVSAARVEQEFDAVSATWDLRVDSGGMKLPWSQPGATGGPVIGTAAWPQQLDSLGVPFDSVKIDIDSATIVSWQDTTTRAKGAVITMSTSGARVRASDIVLRIDAIPSFDPDTVITITIRPAQRTFIFSPKLPGSSSQLRVGGLPAWRTYLHFKEGLDTLTIPCPQVSADCTVKLKDANITYAGVVLTPAVSPSGFLPQDSMRLQSADLLVTSPVPLERSPLGGGLGVSPDFLLPTRFEPPAGSPTTEVPVTTFVRDIAADTASAGTVVPHWLGILPVIEGADFGIAAFNASPMLRLVITVARELQLR
jgi:hypothetical protein